MTIGRFPPHPSFHLTPSSTPLSPPAYSTKSPFVMSISLCRIPIISSSYFSDASRLTSTTIPIPIPNVHTVKNSMVNTSTRCTYIVGLAYVKYLRSPSTGSTKPTMNTLQIKVSTIVLSSDDKTLVRKGEYKLRLHTGMVFSKRRGCFDKMPISALSVSSIMNIHNQ